MSTIHFRVLFRRVLSIHDSYVNIWSTYFAAEGCGCVEETVVCVTGLTTVGGAVCRIWVTAGATGLIPGAEVTATAACRTTAGCSCWAVVTTVCCCCCPGGPTRSIWYCPVSVLTSRCPGCPVGIPCPAWSPWRVDRGTVICAPGCPGRAPFCRITIFCTPAVLVGT